MPLKEQIIRSEHSLSNEKTKEAITETKDISPPAELETPGPEDRKKVKKFGFFNLAAVARQLIGMATAGPIIDRISMRSTKLNLGVREAEMRLPAMIPDVLIMILGNFVVGFGYNRE
ncbi:MAG: hypothetical protein LQ343_007609 [Gyalolechia ehrenbergii]|nr:MAG: hypothetical protein LQ343_007609 [Gyalolechia ehrenbergii]